MSWGGPPSGSSAASTAARLRNAPLAEASSRDVHPAASKKAAGPFWRLYYRERADPEAAPTKRYLDFKSATPRPPPESPGGSRGRGGSTPRLGKLTSGNLRGRSPGGAGSRGSRRSRSRGSSASSVRSFQSSSSRGSNASMLSGLSVDQVRDFSLNHARHARRLRSMGPTMSITAPYRPQVLLVDYKRKLNAKRTAKRVERENGLLTARCAAIKGRTPPTANAAAPRPRRRRPIDQKPGYKRRDFFRPKWSSRPINGGAMFSAVESLAKTRDVSVRPHHYKTRGLPKLEKDKNHFVNLTTGSIYRKGHPALAKPHRPSHANSGAALLARAMKAL
jgi:hypothetical protein